MNNILLPHVELPGASEGPLRGLTFAVKDVFDIAGHRATMAYENNCGAHAILLD
jgi:Asp-tRNA(Asn)/Glu-tRNA(Gln) amidotransferase A subunit family amidase